MSKNFDYSSKDVSKHVEKALRKGEKIGEGHNGVVFLLEDGNIIKFFRRHEAWLDESYILRRVKGSKFFPRIIEIGDNYVVREFVAGQRLDKYLKTHTMDKVLAKALFEMIREFEKLKFKRIDIRCKDIFYNIEKKKVMIIDPKKNYDKNVPYPRHLMKGLYKKDALTIFLDYIKEFDEKKADIWSIKIEAYLKSNTKI